MIIGPFDLNCIAVFPPETNSTWINSFGGGGGSGGGAARSKIQEVWKQLDKLEYESQADKISAAKRIMQRLGCEISEDLLDDGSVLLRGGTGNGLRIDPNGAMHFGPVEILELGGQRHENMAITNYGKLHGRDLALETISRLVPEGAKRNLLISLIAAIEEFRSELPSLLQGTLDLDCFAKVLLHCADNLIVAFHGRLEGWDYLLGTVPIQETFQDVRPHGLRLRQAHNFAKRTSNPQVRDVLLVLISAVWYGQSHGSRDSNGLLLPTYLPAFPFDFLFMAMAVEQSLRPGRPLRSLMVDYDLDV